MNIQADDIIDRGSIAQTERLIRPHIRRTPVTEVNAGDFGLVAARISFKLELLQHAGSFKTRGAFAEKSHKPGWWLRRVATTARRLPMPR